MAIQCLKNGKFQVQIRIGNEKAVAKTFTTYAAAEEFEEVTMRAIRATRSVAETRRVYGRQMKPVGVAALAAMQFKLVADEFEVEEPDHAYVRYVKRLKEVVGDARVSQFDRKWTKDFCARMRKTKAVNRQTFLAEGTIAQYIGMIRRMCNWKAENLQVDKPRLGLTTEFLEPGWDDGRERRLRGQEESRIRAELGMVGAATLWGKKHPPGTRGKPWPCARHYQLLFDFAIETCAREAEMVELPWSEIDLEWRVWNLPAKRSKTKTKRKIYLTPRAMDILRELRSDRKTGDPMVFHLLPKVKCVGNTFRAAINRLGIEDLVFHDLRHEGISRHRFAKTFEPEVLMKMVGHSSPKMTMVYFNPLDEEIFAHMDAAMLRREIPQLPVANALADIEVAALISEGFLSSLAANPILGGEGPEMARARLAMRLREFIAANQAGPLRL